MPEQTREGYWLETNEDESSRLIRQHRYFTAALGGLTPQAIPMQEIHTVLDVACGSGGWLLDLAVQHPHIQGTGIDIAEAALHDAARLVRSHHVSTVSFLQMDATKPLAFADASFDLIHMRTGSPFIRPTQWPAIIAEFVRLLRPGGWLNLVDYEQGPTSSAAFNRISELAMRAVRMSSSSLSPATLTIGAAARLYSFLLNAFLMDVSYSVHPVDFGMVNNPQAPDFIEQLLIGSANIKPFLVQLKLVTADEFDTIMAQAQEELIQPDTCGYSYLISAVGRKEE